jgi:hypothetical protein
VQGGELAGLPWDCLDYDKTVDPADDHRRGIPVQDLKDLLGHSKITSTQAYYRINTERRRAAVARISGLQLTAGEALTAPIRATGFRTDPSYLPELRAYRWS